MRKQKLYSRIPTPALPGSGSRDRTAIRHISAGLRQHPLDCEDILSRLSFFVKPQTHRNGGEVSDKLRKSPALRAGDFLLFREVRNETGSVGFSGRTFPSYDGCAGPGPWWPRRAADATASCRSGCRGRWCGGADPAPDSPASGPQTAGPRSSCRPG